MIKLFSCFIALLAISSCYVHAVDEIQCEVNERQRWIVSGFSRPNVQDQHKHEIHYDCTFDGNVVISNPDTKLSNPPNENVTEIVGKKNAGLEYLPIDIVDAFQNVQKIAVHYTSLKSLSKKTFHGLRKLGYLSISHNQIASIDEDTFDDLEKINKIYLHDNKLSSLPPKVFSKLSTLDTLRLYNNQLTSIDAGIFKNNHKLALLFLNENKLTTFEPGTFDSQVIMRHIWFHANEITSLNSEWFKNCVELVDMMLGGNTITEIPVDFFAHLPSLRSVDFSKNPLTFVDFAMFQNNKEINRISFNDIKFTRVLNIDTVDKLPRLELVKFEINDDSCIIGSYEGPFDKLKKEVKENCKTE